MPLMYVGISYALPVVLQGYIIYIVRIVDVMAPGMG